MVSCKKGKEEILPGRITHLLFCDLYGIGQSVLHWRLVSCTMLIIVIVSPPHGHQQWKILTNENWISSTKEVDKTNKRYRQPTQDFDGWATFTCPIHQAIAQYCACNWICSIEAFRLFMIFSCRKLYLARRLKNVKLGKRIVEIVLCH